MENTNREYFEKMISIQTPQKKEEQSDDNYKSICSLYDAVRHLAKESLAEKLDLQTAKKTIDVILKSAEQVK